MKVNKNKHIIKFFQILMFAFVLVTPLLNGNIFFTPLKIQAAVKESEEYISDTNIPTLNITIDEKKGSIDDMNNDPEHNKKCYGNISFSIPKNYVAEYGKIGIQSEKSIQLDYIKGRGNYSWNNGKKKPYKIKLKNKENLFGMGSNKHWVLIANDEDFTLLKNKIVLYLADKIGMKYVSKSVFVDVVMNGSYLGNYLLTEQIRVGKTRVDIDDIEESKEGDPDTLTGGYLINKDENKAAKVTDEDNCFFTERAFYEIVSPGIEYTTKERKDYITDYVQRAEDAVYAENFQNSKGERYSDLMDTESFVDYFLIQLFTSNLDAFRNSTYFYKERGGKLYWGPVWDFDFSMQGLWNNVKYITANNRYMGKELINDPEIAKRILERYLEIRSNLVELYQKEGYIDQNAKLIEKSVHNDYIKWQRSKNYNDEIENLKEWIDGRIRFMDTYLPSLIKEHYVVTFDLKNGSPKQKVYAASGCSIELLPEPKKDNFTFDGWYYIENGEEKEFIKNTVVLNNMVVTAKWKPKKKNTFILKLDANGGIMKGTKENLEEEIRNISVIEGTSIYPQILAERKGYTFDGWYTEKDGGSQIASYGEWVMDEDTTFYAHWRKISVKQGKIIKWKVLGSKRIKIDIGKISGVSGYELLYADNSKFKQAAKKELSKTSYTLENIKKAKNYYVKVRCYKVDSTGNKVYGKYSNIKKIKS